MILPKDSESDDYTAAERLALEKGLAQSEEEYKSGLAVGPFGTHEEFMVALRGACVRLA